MYALIYETLFKVHLFELQIICDISQFTGHKRIRDDLISRVGPLNTCVVITTI